MRTACLFAILGAASLLSSCGDDRRSQVVTPGIDRRRIEWSEAEQQQIFAFKQLHSQAGTSTHGLRLAGDSGSRVHDHHDLLAVVLSGTADVRLSGKWHNVVAGDVIEIPRGQPYRFERKGAPEAAEFYLVYYPPYDGKDLRMVEGK
jgi:quercetin dioxygenase-like cupin family protein